MGKSKFKGKKGAAMSGPSMYAASKGTGVEQAHELISDMAAARTRLSGKGRSAAGSRLGAAKEGPLVKGRSDIARAALVDKKKKTAAIPADATIVGSGGKKLGA